MKKVVKFGGSSLASAEQFKKVGDIIRSDESRRYVTELSERAVRELEEIGGDNEFLKELVIWLINRDK